MAGCPLRCSPTPSNGMREKLRWKSSWVKIKKRQGDLVSITVTGKIGSTCRKRSYSNQIELDGVKQKPTGSFLLCPQSWLHTFSPRSSDSPSPEAA